LDFVAAVGCGTVTFGLARVGTEGGGFFAGGTDGAVVEGFVTNAAFLERGGGWVESAF